MTTIVHRVPLGSGTLTANCGAALGRNATGQYGPAYGHLPEGWTHCTAGCWAKHRRDLGRAEDGDRIAELRAELTGYQGGKRRALVSA